jgi:hypothetical protein
MSIKKYARESMGQGCSPMGHVLYYLQEQHRAPMKKDLNAGPVLWSNSFLTRNLNKKL